MKDIERCHLLGVWINDFTLDSFYAVIGESIETRTRCVIAHHNLHSIYLYHRDPQMRALYTLADYTFVDGMPIIWWGRVLGLPLRAANRFTSIDWLPPLMQQCAHRQWKIFYLGGMPGTAEVGAEQFRTRFPCLQIATGHGYFDLESEEANQQIIHQINAWGTDLLLVGMGMPRQEHWIVQWREQIQAPCVLPVGAALDYVAGVIPTPSRTMSRLGLEWLMRLLAEPSRLWRRYLIEPWFLLRYAAGDVKQRWLG